MRLMLFMSLLIASFAAGVAIADPASEKPNFRRPMGDDDLRYWLGLMIWHYRFTGEEISASTGLTADEIGAAVKRWDITPESRPARPAGAPLLVLPYPGGRHPRIGFLDGAVRPQRETKIGVFTPWDDKSYVVADVPEAIWSNLGLTYLAHTHVPTIWDKQQVELAPLEWKRRDDGVLEVERKLPNGITFGTRVTPAADAVRMEMWLVNGTQEALSDLRVQNCVMLKGAASFDQQTNDNKVFKSPYVAVHSTDGRRWIITAWDPCDRAWGNAPCPCLHSDPKFPDCPPHQTRRLKGWLSFYEGTDLDAELVRIEKTEWRTKSLSENRPREGGSAAVAADSGYKVEIRVVEKKSGNPLPCRIHLKDPAGKPLRAGKLPFWHDHFVCPGMVELELPAGEYGYEVEHGPEFSTAVSTFTVGGDGPVKFECQLARLVDLAAEGWWSGELHVHRPVEDMKLLMRAEDLHVAPVITWWNNRNIWADQQPPENSLRMFDETRYYDVMAGEDEREGGAMLYFHLRRPLDITGAAREYPSPLKFAMAARENKNVWIDVEKPFWWDMPVWLAAGQVDSLGLANNHMCHSQMYETEAWGKPRDAQRLPPPLGNGYWTQEVYYHVLNCGLRIPPSAGSASGVLPNPVGYNRVYAHVEGEFSYAKWWDALRAGRVFVTNGPLLRAKVDGKLPGHVFTAGNGGAVDLPIEITLTSRDTIRTIEIVKNGEVAQSVPYDEWVKNGSSSLGTIRFSESGWFLVRAIADNPRTFRFASTGPFYVEIGKTPRRISKASAQFFLGWVAERAGRVKLDDPGQRQEVLKHHTAAKEFWQRKVAEANAP